jgi:hypothetical protein
MLNLTCQDQCHACLTVPATINAMHVRISAMAAEPYLPRMNTMRAQPHMSESVLCLLNIVCQIQSPYELYLPCKGQCHPCSALSARVSAMSAKQHLPGSVPCLPHLNCQVPCHAFASFSVSLFKLLKHHLARSQGQCYAPQLYMPALGRMRAPLLIPLGFNREGSACIPHPCRL